MSETAPTNTAAAVSEPPADAPASPAAVAAPASEQGNTDSTAAPSSKTAAAAPKEATASTASKDNTAASKPSVMEQVKRYIPGLGSKDEPAKAGKRKKSGKKTTSSAPAVDIAHAKDPALATATLETAPSREELPKELQASGKPRIAGLNGTSVESEVDTKKFSAAAYVQKRLRTNNKKIVSLIWRLLGLCGVAESIWPTGPI